MSSIHLKVKRLGGAYGAKISRPGLIAGACALVCQKLSRPARLVMSIEDNMRMIGKRVSSYMEYDVNVNEMGKIQEINAMYWGNLGGSFNETHSYGAVSHFYNCYDPSTWRVSGNDVKTDIPPNTWCRSPGKVN